MLTIYECHACGSYGSLNDIYYEEVDGTLECRECNGGGELCLQTELREHEEKAKEIGKGSSLSDALEGWSP